MPDIRATLFGKLVMETGLVTEEQIEECLLLQEEYEKAGEEVPRLGELLAAKEYLTPDQVRDILVQQRSTKTQDLPATPVASGPIDMGGDEELAPTIEPPEEEEAEEYFFEEAEEEEAETPGLAADDTFGDFRIEERLGTDSRASTYRAIYTPKDITVILRILDEGASGDDPEFVREFDKTVKRAVELRNPHIQKIVAGGRTNNQNFYAAQYIDGRSLRRIIEDDEKIEPAAAAKMALELARALEYGHSHGLTHSEVRPSNVMINKKGQAVLLGFGVARDVIGNIRRLVEQGDDTPFYIAPEQGVDVDGQSKSDPRTDIYCLGVTLYHAVTGFAPFHGQSVKEVLLSLAEDDVEDPAEIIPEVNRDFSDLILSMMNPEPDSRYQTATQLVEALEPIVAHFENPNLEIQEEAPPARKSRRIKAGGTRKFKLRSKLGGAAGPEVTVKRQTNVSRARMGASKRSRSGIRSGRSQAAEDGAEGQESGRRERGRKKGGNETVLLLAGGAVIAIIAVVVGLLVYNKQQQEHAEKVAKYEEEKKQRELEQKQLIEAQRAAAAAAAEAKAAGGDGGDASAKTTTTKKTSSTASAGADDEDETVDAAPAKKAPTKKKEEEKRPVPLWMREG